MDKRFEELTERLVASGRPADHFSCSELHELYDGIKKLEAENEKLQNTSSHSDHVKSGTCAGCKHFKDCETEDKACCPEFA